MTTIAKTTSEYFDGRAEQAQLALERFNVLDVQIFEGSGNQGDHEITERIRQDLIAERDEYRRVADFWRR